MSSEEHRASETFDFDGFAIPADLAILTGGGEDTWEGISRAHTAAYDRYSPIQVGHHVLEVGCGVGRDAIPLAKELGPEGSYIGLDISRPSITWCQENITPRYSHATFEHVDIRSEFYNPAGRLTASEIDLPIGKGKIDRIILQSVFTHMFENDIVHFLSEFRRVLRSDGLVFASFFIVDDHSLRLAAEQDGVLTFQHPWGAGCRINDPQTPEGAVGYTTQALDRILRKSGMILDQPIHLGSWTGRQNVPDGQDIIILRRAPTRRNLLQPLQLMLDRSRRR